MKFASSTKNEVLKFGEVRSSSSLKSLFATQAKLAPTQTAPVVDEDGFTTVSKGKKNRKASQVPESAGRGAAAPEAQALRTRKNNNEYYSNIDYFSQILEFSAIFQFVFANLIEKATHVTLL